MKSFKQAIKAHPTLWKLLKQFEVFLVFSVALGASLHWIIIHISPEKIFYSVSFLIILGPIIFYCLSGPINKPFYYKIFLPLIWRSSPNPLRKFISRYMSTPQKYRADLIYKSQQFNSEQPEGIYSHGFWEGKLPPVVRCEDLRESSEQYDAEFSIVLLNNRFKLKRKNGNLSLTINLIGENCAVYDGRGKQFLRHLFQTEESKQKHSDLSEQIHNFLKTQGEAYDARSFNIAGLRWASGGLLPIAKWKGKKWLVVFYRDIFPVGWNITNGASENYKEYTDLTYLIYRETLEELVICNNQLESGSKLNIMSLSKDHQTNEEKSLFKTHHRKEYIRLRSEHDNIYLEDKPGPELTLLKTNQQVKVLHDNDNDNENTNKTPNTTDNILIAVNPSELGIEIVKIGEFELKDDEVIVDGEINFAGKEPYLVRQPLGLISIDYLYEQFLNGESNIGENINEAKSPNARYIGEIPRDQYHIFLDDIKLRRDRNKFIESQNKSEQFKAEKYRNDTWLNELATPFEQCMEEDGTLKDDLAWLLPSTWKLLELAFEHNIITPTKNGS